MMKCIICNKPAKWRFSPDLDINGIGTCKKHLEDVRFGYVMLLQGDKEMFEDYIEGLKKKYEKKSKSISFTDKRKRKSIIGEWTKASHKRLLIEELEKKEFKEGEE